MRFTQKMTGLKTLKDIGNDARFCSKLPMFARTELKELLCEEAIKWIKTMRSDNGIQAFHCHTCFDTENVVWWIQTFFNLEEEDLE